MIDDLDSITGCNEHKELGTSEDGNYKYYLSINKDAESDTTDEIEKIETTITEMTALIQANLYLICLQKMPTRMQEM